MRRIHSGVGSAQLRGALSSTTAWSGRPTAQARCIGVALYLWAAAHREHSGGRAPLVRPNAALTSFAAWFRRAERAPEPGYFTCRGGRQACGLPSPAQVSAAFSRTLRVQENAAAKP